MPGLSLPTEQDLILMLRISLAFIFGAVIGWERQQDQRPAGLRTHVLVAAGAAAFTVVSIYGFAGLGASNEPSRLAAQIVTGIGFIGAGVIFIEHRQPHGLTTAASIWIAAALGVLAGTGMVWVGIFTTALTWFVLRVLKRVEGTNPAGAGKPTPDGGTPDRRPPGV